MKEEKNGYNERCCNIITVANYCLNVQITQQNNTNGWFDLKDNYKERSNYQSWGSKKFRMGAFPIEFWTTALFVIYGFT